MVKLDKSILKRIDLVNIFIITMFFGLIMVFSYLKLDANPGSIFLVFLVMVGTIVGYYTNITASLLYSIMFVFLYASFQIYLNVAKRVPIGGDVYFWMLAVPLFTIMFAYYGTLIRDLQEKNSSLMKENEELVMIDKDTGLLSSQAFFKELQVYMKINERFNIDLYLMLIKVKYENEVIRILGESKYNKMVNEISKVISSMLREEDRKLILRDANMFAVILLSNKGGAKSIKERLKGQIQNIDFKDDAVINNLNLEVMVGVAQYHSEEKCSPYEFFKKAERDLEYDV
ncbi:MAG TPA: diguanylate cyclase [Bacillota bacterium]|nr:diguanylate cyclase [Bacillota bacterium]HPT87596.1 diguanylate cyclase [Bacillota bacterium]